MRPLLVAFAVSVAGCATAAPARNNADSITHAAAARQEVIAVAEALFSAMRTRDTAMIRTLFVAETQIVSLRLDGSSAASPVRRSVTEFITSLARPGAPLIEQMWDPTVEIDRDFASLWAPYDFHVGERFSHCGYDAFHFVRRDARWKIVALSYTTQSIGCGTRK